MTNLINAYATVTTLPALRFTHELRGQRDLDDPELPDHLGGSQGFVMQGGQRQMTQTRYHVLRHIERVRHHALDLHLRLHWAVREARRSKAAPDQLEAGVISERHHALNWLVRFGESPWDEVQTPT
jgi:Domain of unknown function (DUF4272)